MFNDTSKIVSGSFQQNKAVILPHSGKALSSQDIDERIEKARGHIKHLTAQVPHRNTHGGKAFREKRISLQNQIALTSDRLSMLQTARATMLKSLTAAPLATGRIITRH